MRVQISGNLICPACGQMMENSIDGTLAKCVTDNCEKHNHVFAMPYTDVECFGLPTIDNLWYGCFADKESTV